MTDELKPGSWLGRFRIIRSIGAGSVGMVYLAHDSLLSADVALKILSPPYSREKFFERMKREVLLARKVTHPGICRIFDLHEEEGLHFISMEHIDGQTLGSIIRENGIIPPRKAGQLTLDICRAMTAAHRLKIIHRDLKPGNIMVRAGSRISILDFGFARELDADSITGAGMAVGTIQYMSPEILSAKQATMLSDIYSVGVILYNCVTGRLPFEKSSLLQMMEAIECGNSVPPKKFNSEIPDPLEAVIAKAMAAIPTDRYKSFPEFAQAIQNILNDLPAEAEQPTSSPWHGDIEKSVHALLTDSTASASLRVGVRETTILFSDIVGITPYFDKHGDTAGHKKIQTHNQMLFPIIRRHRGKVIKTIGDAIMACFDQADDGVEAAMEMQRAIYKYNSGIDEDEEDEQILVRIGLHSGRSVFENRDVFGNTVNVAARIGSRASGGEILISSFTREMLDRNRKAAHFHGVTTLKGKRDIYNLYSVGWMEVPSDSSTHNLPITAVRTLTDRPDLGSEADFDIDTDPHVKEAPIPPVETVVDDLVDLGSKDDVQAESDTDPMREKPSDWGEKITINAELASETESRPMVEEITTLTDSTPLDEEPTRREERPPIHEPSWNLVPIDYGEESSTQDPITNVKTMVADSAPLGRLFKGGHRHLYYALAGIAVVVAFGLSVGLNWFSSSSSNGEKTGSDDPGSVTTAGAMLDATLAALEKPFPVAVSETEATAPEADRILPQNELNELRKKLASAMHRKGILLSDNKKLQAEYNRMRRLEDKARFEEALASGKRTLTVVEGIRINRSFIGDKLNRFNALYDTIHDNAASRRTMDLARGIIAAIEADKYHQANKLLNRAFQVLESMQR